MARGNCAVDLCFHNLKNNRNCRPFSHFPSSNDLDRYKKWVKFTGNPDMLSIHPDECTRLMCSCHFEGDQFRETPKKMLKKTAFPTVNLNENSRPLEEESFPPNWPHNLINSNPIHRSRKRKVTSSNLPRSLPVDQLVADIVDLEETDNNPEPLVCEGSLSILSDHSYASTTNEITVSNDIIPLSHTASDHHFLLNDVGNSVSSTGYHSIVNPSLILSSNNDHHIKDNVDNSPPFSATDHPIHEISNPFSPPSIEDHHQNEEYVDNRPSSLNSEHLLDYVSNPTSPSNDYHQIEPYFDNPPPPPPPPSSRNHPLNDVETDNRTPFSSETSHYHQNRDVTHDDQQSYLDDIDVPDDVGDMIEPTLNNLSSVSADSNSNDSLDNQLENSNNILNLNSNYTDLWPIDDNIIAASTDEVRIGEAETNSSSFTPEEDRNEEVDFEEVLNTNSSSSSLSSSSKGTEAIITTTNKRKPTSVAIQRMTKKRCLQDLGLDKVTDTGKRIDSLLSELILTKRDHNLMKNKYESMKEVYNEIAKAQKKMDDNMLLSKIHSEQLRNLVKMDIKNAGKTGKQVHGRRWNNDVKLWAAAQYKAGPAAYRQFQEGIIVPSKNTIHRALMNVPMKVGTNPQLLQMISEETEVLKEDERDVLIVFDEMVGKTRLSLNRGSNTVSGFVNYGNGETEPIKANRFLVYMVIGLKKGFKQPTHYFFTEKSTPTSKLKSLTQQVIRDINKTGLNVVGTVCDQGSPNNCALKELKKETEDYYKSIGKKYIEGEYFEFEGCRNPIWIIKDPPHLAKTTRNNLMGPWEDWRRAIKRQGNPQNYSDDTLKYLYPGQCIYFDGKHGCWRDFLLLYFDSLTSPTSNKALTDNNAYPNSFTKMRVKYAVQIFRDEIVERLHLHKKVTKSSFDTADVFNKIKEMFQYLMGLGDKQIVTDSSGHIEKWQEFRQLAEGMFYYKKIAKTPGKAIKASILEEDDTSATIKISTPTPAGLKSTFAALEGLWNFLKNERSFTELNLSYVCQDCLENTFGLIRSSLGDNRMPTCDHFVSALKSVIITRFALRKSINSNCEEDGLKPLLGLTKIVYRCDSDPAAASSTSNASLYPPSNMNLSTELSLIPVDQTSSAQMPMAESSPTSNDSEQLYTIHLEDDDDDDDEDFFVETNDGEILRLMLNEETFARILIKKLGDIKCKKCSDDIQLLCREEPRRTQLHKFIKNSQDIFDQKCNNILHLEDVVFYVKSLISIEARGNWLSCKELHSSQLLSDLFEHTSRLLIIERLKILNRPTIEAESRSAGAAKVAQQASTAKK